MMHSVQRRSHQRPIVVMNSDTERIPQFAAMEVRHVDRDGRIWVRKPQYDDLPPQRVLLNGPISIEPHGSGTAQGSFPMRAFYHLDDGAADNRDSVGTRAGHWDLHQGYEGFLVWGHPDNSLDQIVVQPDTICREHGGNVYYYGHGCEDRCCCWRCGPNRVTDPSNTSGFSGPTTLTVSVYVECIGTETVACALDYCGCDPAIDASTCSGPNGEGLDMMRWSGSTVSTVSGSCTNCQDPFGLPVIWPAIPKLSATVTCRYVLTSDGGLLVRLFTLSFTIASATGLVGGTLPIPLLSCSPLLAEGMTHIPPDIGVLCLPGLPNIPNTLCVNCVGSNYGYLITE